MPRCLLALAQALTLSLFALPLSSSATWLRHTIDGPDAEDGRRGADGVRLADANRDGLLDITTGWEQGGSVRVCLNPGPENSKDLWPAVTIGSVRGVEDAVFVDLDHDGAIDVVSSTEDKNKPVYVHWAPASLDDYLKPEAWSTKPIPATALTQQWMFCLPINVDDKNGIDLVLGSKGETAAIGWLESPSNPRNLEAWKYHRLQDARWIMSIRKTSPGASNPATIIYSDRKGPATGVYRLSGVNPPLSKKETLVAEDNDELLFLDVLNDPPAPIQIFVPRRIGPIITPLGDLPRPNSAGAGKAVRVGDINLDDQADLVLTCGLAKGNLSGVWWHDGQTWRNVSGPEGIKFDRIELLDLDDDGDLDIITCEEATDLGVIWYENPHR
ncbi:MAG: VCBS repeat-containing protein [Verrucomicrobiota bacterium]